MPGGATAGTAALISSLPYSDADTVPTTAGLWYRYIASAIPNEISIFAYAATLSNQRVRVFSPDAVTDYPPTDPGNWVNSRPLQIPVVAGITYYINVYNQAGAYTLSVIAGPNEAAPIGSIFVNDDAGGWPLALLSGTDGHALRFIHPFPAGETGDVIATGAHTGRILVHNRIGSLAQGDGHLHLYSPQFVLLADLPYTPAGDSFTCPIRASKTTSRFYVAQQTDPLNANNGSVTTVTSAGAFGPTTWNLTATYDLAGVAPSADETILYTRRLSGGSSRIVGRWDLINNLELPDLAPAVTNFFLDDMLVLTDDTIIAGYRRNVGNVTPFVRRYATDGTILNTYTLTGSHSQDLRLAQAIDDSVSFWVWTKADVTGGLAGPTTLNVFTNLRASDGTILSTFSVPQFNHGAYQGAKSATPIAYFGASESCPFLILRVAVPLITGTIAVTLPSAASGSDSDASASLSLTGYVLPPRHLERLCYAVMTIAALAPDARQRIFSSLGVLVSGAKLYTYVAGSSSTALATYNDSGLTVANPNPLISSADGLFGPIYLLPQAYHFVLRSSTGELIWDQDQVYDTGELLEATLTAATDAITALSASVETKFCTTATTATSTTTLANVTGLTSFTLTAGATYAFDINLSCTSTASGGVKAAFKYTGASLTSLESVAQGFTSSATATQHVTSTTDQASLFTQAAAVLNVKISGRIVVTTGGTLAIQAAQNTSHSDTSTILTGSSATFRKIS